MADEIWIYDFETKETKAITDNGVQDIIPMWAGDEIYFLSDRDRTMNLFVYNTASGESSKVTDFTEYDIKFPSLGKDYIVFENGGYIYKFSLASKQAEKVSIQIANENSFSRTGYVDASEYINDRDLAPGGERVIFGARGDIYSLPAKSGITRNLTQTPGAHERDITWSPDGKYIAYVSDESGEYEVYMMKQDASEKPVQLTTGSKSYLYQIRWSPDSKKILFSDRALTLKYVDVATKKVTLVIKSERSELRDFNWSPDSKWIAFTETDDNEFDVIYLYRLETGSIHPVTDNWYDSGNPAFSADGKYLFFVSRRDFNPTYSNTEWNHSYSNMSKVYLATLAADTPSPFAPENDEVKTDSEAASASTDADKKDKGDSSDEKPAISVKIDTEKLNQRILSLPVGASNYFNLQAVTDKVYYSERSSGGRGPASLKMFDLKKKEETELGSGINYIISASGKKMLVFKGDQRAVIDLPQAKIDIKDPIDVSSMNVLVDYRQEWEQVFEESWRQMRDFFYVPNMHGLDWNAMHDKYSVLLPYVNHRNDLTYVIGEMIAELSVGHAYVLSGDQRPTPERIPTGLLGAKLSKHSSGFFRIDEILEGANWNSASKSPLTEIGVNVKEGEFITAVNGQSTSTMEDIYAALVNTAGKQVELSVNSAAQESGSRKAIIVPIDDESSLYYYGWVQDNIRKVNEATNGQIGYIHIPDMGANGLNEFAKYFYPQLNKKGLIIDDRGNGGGNVSPMIIERLSREMTHAAIMRGITEGDPVPRQTVLGPKVLLINYASASDGDLFPYQFKQKKLGTVIGTRTWGGVVGIRGSLPFIDGGSLQKPEFAHYSASESKWIIEGIGVEPDIFLDNDPAREYSGIDDQLNKAIEVIMEQLDQYTPVPAVPPAPDKSK